jgi:hypothetical protein
MPTKTQLSIIVALAAVVWLGVLAFSGVELSLAMLKPYSIVVTAVGGGFVVFDRWLWRWRPLFGWLVHRPDLSGTWLATLAPIPQPGGPVDLPPIRAYVTVYQTFTALSVRLYSDESSSEQLAGEIRRAPDDTYTLAVVYRNTPRISLQERSRSHQGAMLLELSADPTATPRGHYWTDRFSIGEISLDKRNHERADSFSSARQLFAA